MFIVRKFSKQKNYSKAAAFEIILCGGCWSPLRRPQCGLVEAEEARCKNCGEWQCDECHQFWERDALATTELVDVKYQQADTVRKNPEGHIPLYVGSWDIAQRACAHSVCAHPGRASL